MIRLFNKAMAECANYGNWQEELAQVYVTASATQADYTFPSNVKVKAIYEVAISGRVSPLTVDTIDSVRHLNRSGSIGEPNRFTVFGTDANGNPKMQVTPVPTSAYSGRRFDILYHNLPAEITTADASTVPIYPANVLAQGLHAHALLDESGGKSTPEFQASYELFSNYMKQAYNRFNSDTGPYVSFVPSYRGGRR